MRCEKCGAKLKEKSNFCPNCGTEVHYEKKRKRSYLVVVIVILLVGAIGGGVFVVSSQINKNKRTAEIEKTKERNNLTYGNYGNDEMEEIYNQAISYYENGEWQEAGRYFGDILDYEDSYEKYNECIYESIKEEYENNNISRDTYKEYLSLPEEYKSEDVFERPLDEIVDENTLNELATALESTCADLEMYVPENNIITLGSMESLNTKFLETFCVFSQIDVNDKIFYSEKAGKDSSIYDVKFEFRDSTIQSISVQDLSTQRR